MREIKFRVYDKADHDWYKDGKVSRMSYFGEEYFIDDEGYLKLLSPSGKAPIGDHNQDRFSPLMQYTGLKDKNGKESFHKDIVEEPDGRRYTVEWNEDDGRWELQSIEHVAGTHYIRHFKDIKIMKVIGNIYENPELISV